MPEPSSRLLPGQSVQIKGIIYKCAPGPLVTCPIPHCKRTFQNTDSWRKHVRQSHLFAIPGHAASSAPSTTVLVTRTGADKATDGDRIAPGENQIASRTLRGEMNANQEPAPSSSVVEGRKRVELVAGVNYLESSRILAFADFAFHRLLKVLICRTCGTCQDPSTAFQHARNHQRLRYQPNPAFEAECLRLGVTTASNADIPAPCGPPVQGIPTSKGFACTAHEECPYACGAIKTMRNHIRATHKISSTVANPRYRHCDVQTLFAPLHREYFEVIPALAYEQDPSALLTKFLKETATLDETAPVRSADTIRERTPFLRRMGWDEQLDHIRGHKSKRESVRDLLALPKDAQLPLGRVLPLTKSYLSLARSILAGESNAFLVQKTLKHGLNVGQLPKTTPHVERYWSPLVEEHSIHEYSQLLAKFVVATIRTLDDDPVGFRIPLNGSQRRYAAEFRSGLDGHPDAECLFMLHRLLCTLFCPGDRPLANAQNISCPFSAFFALHALRMDGLFDGPSVFTQVIAKFKYLAYTCALHDANDKSTGDIVSAARQSHEKYIALGSDKPFNMLYELMQFATSIVLNENKPPTVFWSPDMKSVAVHGSVIVLEHVRSGIKGMFAECRKLLVKLRGETSLITKTGSFRDELRNETREYSFLTHGPFTAGRQANIQRMVNRDGQTLAYLDANGTVCWNLAQMLGFLSTSAQLNQLLCVLCYLLPTISTRITQHIDHKIRNDLRPRNLHMVMEEMILVTRYHKMSNVIGYDQYVPAFVPAELKEVMLEYLGSIRDTEEQFGLRCFGEQGRGLYRTFLWVTNGKRMTTEQFSGFFELAMEKFCGVAIKPRSYRQAAISWAREFIPPSIHHLDRDNVADQAASHSTSVARNHYAINGDDLAELTVDQQYAFREVSQAWQTLLGLGDTPPPLPIRFLRHSGYGAAFEQKTSASLSTLTEQVSALTEKTRDALGAIAGGPAPKPDVDVLGIVREALGSDEMRMHGPDAPPLTTQMRVLEHVEGAILAHIGSRLGLLAGPVIRPGFPPEQAGQLARPEAEDTPPDHDTALDIQDPLAAAPCGADGEEVASTPRPATTPPSRKRTRPDADGAGDGESAPASKSRKLAVGDENGDGENDPLPDYDSDGPEYASEPDSRSSSILYGDDTGRVDFPDGIWVPPTLNEFEPRQDVCSVYADWRKSLTSADLKRARAAIRGVLKDERAEPKGITQLHAICAVLHRSGPNKPDSESGPNIRGCVDVSIVMRTGGGKSMVWMAAAMAEPDIGGVVICPYIPLLQQHLATARNADIPACRWRSGIRPPLATRLLFMQPESARSRDFKTFLAGEGNRFKRVYFDESHLLVDTHPRRVDVFADMSAQIQKMTVQRIWLTATAPPQLQTRFYRAAKVPEQSHPLTIRDSTDRPELGYHVICRKPAELRKSLRSLVHSVEALLEDHERAIVFFMSRKLVDEFAREFSSAKYHSQLPDEEREANLVLWDSGTSKILAATTSIAQGIDRAHVKFVIVYDSAFGLVPFVQQMGRAGRSGEKAYCIFLAREIKGKGKGNANDILDEKDTGLKGWLSQYILNPHGHCRRRILTSVMDGTRCELRCKNVRDCNPCDICSADAPDEAMSMIMGGLEISPNSAVRLPEPQSPTKRMFRNQAMAGPSGLRTSPDPLVLAQTGGSKLKRPALNIPPSRPPQTSVIITPPRNIDVGRPMAPTSSPEEFFFPAFSTQELIALDMVDQQAAMAKANGGKPASTTPSSDLNDRSPVRVPRRKGNGVSSSDLASEDKPVSNWGSSPAPEGGSIASRRLAGIRRTDRGEVRMKSPYARPCPSNERAHLARSRDLDRRTKSETLDRIMRGLKRCCPYHFVVGTVVEHKPNETCPSFSVRSQSQIKDVRALFKFKPYSYCYCCGLPQGKRWNGEEVRCHQEIGYGQSSQNPCPWNNFVYSVVMILWASTPLRSSILTEFGLDPNMTQPEYGRWLAIEKEDSGRYYNGLEVFLWFCSTHE